MKPWLFHGNCEAKTVEVSSETHWKSFVSFPNWIPPTTYTASPMHQGEHKLHCWSLGEIFWSLAYGGWLPGGLFSFTKHCTTVGMPKACYTSPVKLSCTGTVPHSWKWDDVFIGVSCSQLESCRHWQCSSRKAVSMCTSCSSSLPSHPGLTWYLAVMGWCGWEGMKHMSVGWARRMAEVRVSCINQWLKGKQVFWLQYAHSVKGHDFHISECSFCHVGIIIFFFFLISIWCFSSHLVERKSELSCKGLSGSLHSAVLVFVCVILSKKTFLLSFNPHPHQCSAGNYFLCILIFALCWMLLCFLFHSFFTSSLSAHCFIPPFSYTSLCFVPGLHEAIFHSSWFIVRSTKTFIWCTW